MRERDIRLFEIGVVFEARGQGNVPRERWRVAGVLSGDRVPPHWSASGKSPGFDIWDLKGIFEDVARRAVPDGTVAAGEGGWTVRDPSGAVRGTAAAQTLARPPWAAPVLGFELDIAGAARSAVRFRPPAVMPPVERDIALVLPEGVSAADVGAIIKRAAGPLLERAGVFDEYRGAGVRGRSVAWRLVFRSPERTLRDDEADAALRRVLAALKEDLGVELRQA